MQDNEVSIPNGLPRRNVVLGTPSELRDFAPLLKWLLVNVLLVVVLIVLWDRGLVQTVLATDRTRVSLIIAGIFVLTVAHCCYQTWITSRDLVVARRVRDKVAETDNVPVQLADGRVMVGGAVLEPGVLTTHIANLIRKAGMSSTAGFDQTVLLRSLADRLRTREKLGLFVSESLLRLALLGTALGFILMLIPLSGLTSFDTETLRTALTAMTSGMAIALNVTVTGIGCALILKFEYYLLDTAIAELFEITTETTEVGIIPRIGKVDG
jgi:hypothetical protein